MNSEKFIAKDTSKGFKFACPPPTIDAAFSSERVSIYTGGEILPCILEFMRVAPGFEIRASAHAPRLLVVQGKASTLSPAESKYSGFNFGCQ